METSKNFIANCALLGCPLILVRFQTSAQYISVQVEYPYLCRHLKQFYFSKELCGVPGHFEEMPTLFLCYKEKDLNVNSVVKSMGRWSSSYMSCRSVAAIDY